MYRGTTTEVSELSYLLEFVKYVIEENELENTTSAENWHLGSSIDKQIEILNGGSVK